MRTYSVRLEKMLNRDYDLDLEMEVRQFEQDYISFNFSSGALQRYAKEHRQLLLNCTTVPEINTFEQACTMRYLWVPIFYKLGKSAIANQIGQSTFVYFFPTWHERIKNKIDQLIGQEIEQSLAKIRKLFQIKHNDIDAVYYRLKSTNSVWKKVESISALQAMDNNDFSQTVRDYLAFRWNMAIRCDENRYDALVRSIELLPKIEIIKFRNQQIAQASGFDCEPVMKFLFLTNNIPIELQVLGGQLELYMSAKGYADYKAGLNFHPQQKDLSVTQWNARLGNCIHYAETAQIDKYHQLMMAELLGEEINYDETYLFELNKQPRILENQQKLAQYSQRFDT